MAIATGNLFKVVEVATQALYTAIAVKDPATAYYVRETKKIIVDSIEYGFNPADITSTILFNLLESVDTDTIDLTITNEGGKVKVSASVKVEPIGTTGFKLIWYSSPSDGLAAYNATDLDGRISTTTNTTGGEDRSTVVAAAIYAGTSTPSNAGWIYSDWFSLANGNDVIVRDQTDMAYEYYKMVPGDNLIEVSSTGLSVRKLVIQDMIDDSIDAAVTNKLGVANGIATLGADGLIPSAQLPSYVDDIIDVIIRTGQSSVFTAARFANLADGAGGTAITPTSGKIYNEYSGPSTPTNKIYRWSGTAYVEIRDPNLKTLNNETLYGTGNISIAQWTVVSS